MEELVLGWRQFWSYDASPRTARRLSKGHEVLNLWELKGGGLPRKI